MVQPKPIAIDSLTEDVLGRYSQELKSKRIRLDKELASLTARVFPKFIDSAVGQLIENAIEATSPGGELNITLIDGDDCWELEIADSPYEEFPRDQPIENGNRNSPLEQSRMEVVRRAAVVHGGKIQTWECPQGGIANVLVIPRRQETNKAA